MLDIGYLQIKIRELNTEVSLLGEKIESFTMSIDTKINSAQQIISELDKKKNELLKENLERDKFSHFLVGMKDKAEEMHRRNFTKMTEEQNEFLRSMMDGLSKECRLDIIDSVAQTTVLLKFLSEKGIVSSQDFSVFLDKNYDGIVNFTASLHGNWKLTVPKLFTWRSEAYDKSTL